MGIRSIDDDGLSGDKLHTFSENILKIEISGPDVNMPGIRLIELH
jgi:hypothetical protein